jgi:FkbM family methyltransferase
VPIADRVRTFREVSAVVAQPLRLSIAQVRHSPRTGRYRLRGSGIVIALRHDVLEDLATLIQTFRQGHYDPPPEAAAALNALGRPPHALDLGANIGMFGAWFLGRTPGARVTAYEADPDNARVHAETVAANPDLAWEVHAAAAATADGEVAFLAGHATNSRLAEPGEQAVTVPAHDVLARAGDVDLLKIDIEGAEWALLADPRFAALPARVVALEFHPERCPGPDPHAAALEHLRAAGYEVAEGHLEATAGHGMVWGWRTV